MSNAFEQTAKSLSADPLPLCAALQAAITIITILLQQPLRNRRSRPLQLLSLVVALTAVAGITTLFALTLQVVLRGGPRVSVRAIDFVLRFALEDGLWSIVREVSAPVWRAVAAAGLVAVYLHALALVVLTPVVQAAVPVPQVPKRVNSGSSIARSSTSSTKSMVFDFNRVWLNVALLLILLAAVGGFAGAVIGTRAPLPNGAVLRKPEARKKAQRTRIGKEDDLSECVCKSWPNCNKSLAGKKSTCLFAIKSPYKRFQLFQCLTGVDNVPAEGKSTIVRALDDKCATGPNGRNIATTFSAVLVATQFVMVLLLVVMAVLRWPLLMTASFVLSAYLVFAVALTATLPFLLSFDTGRVNFSFGLKLDRLFLATATGPSALRLARVVVAFMFSQIGMSAVASATEWRRIDWTLSLYSILRFKPNNDTYDHYTYDEGGDGDPEA